LINGTRERFRVVFFTERKIEEQDSAVLERILQFGKKLYPFLRKKIIQLIFLSYSCSYKNGSFSIKVGNRISVD
jgi:hypothetical protein